MKGAIRAARLVFLWGLGVAFCVGCGGQTSGAGQISSVSSGGVGSSELISGGLAASEREEAEWLAEGEIPGEEWWERELARGALGDLHSLMAPGGAIIAAPQPRWNRVWVRDSSWAVAALTASGHGEDAHRALTFLAAVQEPGGGWEARYRPDGEPVLDGRVPQLDATGWFPWAVWFWYRSQPPGQQREERLHALWPAVNSAAEAAARSLGSVGLPPAGPDYWESSTPEPSIGTAAPLRTGLRAAADLGRELGHGEEARRYSEAAVRLDAAIRQQFGAHGYPRTTDPASGADAAVTFLGPPFAPANREVEEAVGRTAHLLRAPDGGMIPGERWPGGTEVAWTPETAFFALSAAASGREEEARRWLVWLSEHRTPAGFPEKVGPEGEPSRVAPLGWTASAVVLAISASEEPLPMPPAQPGL